MQINHNIAALNTLNHLNSAQNAQAKSMQKLSSGLRINSASDDAAGLAISEKMRGQIRGLDQATRNAQDGISMLSTAEGALNETHDILQRMRELAVQSSNDTNTDQDRQNIQSEFSQLGQEIDRIGNNTQFNTKNLLDGSMGKAQATNQANINTSAAVGAAAGATAFTALTDASGNSLGIQAGDSVTVSYVMNGSNQTISLTGASTVGSIMDANLSTAAAGGKMVVTANAGGLTGAINGLTITVKDSTGNVRTTATNALSSFTETQAAKNQQVDGSANLLIGANGGQNLNIDINDMRAQALGVNNLQVSTQSQANTAIKVIDTAIQKVSAERAKIGAFSNRLDHTINNLSTSSENLTSAESRIRDVDYALAA